ncbi:unnamed protein product [Heligmosomoides polygyrus]|uniref:G_PROTEIN_RECEP_F1_2 domain-containing protein n=1 Tax=Heligmosomoides polygyrus TaxID=6339 RepID=A0A3P8CXB3_HELPZ|nr:unnamed protein product [Heligmosomoides polygyrus]
MIQQHFSCLFLLALCSYYHDCIHHLAVPLLAKSPCQIFLSKTLFVATHIPFVFVIYASQFVQVAIIVERCTAVVFIHKYETGFKTLGPVLFVAAVSEVFRKFESLNSASFFNLFDGLYINSRVYPDRNYFSANVIIFSMLLVNLVGLTVTVALRYLSPKRRLR